ncbi:ankyrin-1 [Colletotrichum musicola]|uniref:Ankyrin-1 n=1 Tax=Colletotrichum musicola TaxID=2175873 RepID=A0A8H6JZQ3_9PEZI|nr:ankyrin-1 [Colletotrichum musicola]
MRGDASAIYALTASSIHLVGFPRAEAGRALDVSSRVVSPTEWAELVPHLAPEAQVKSFVLFGDKAAAIASLGPTPTGRRGAGFHQEDEDLNSGNQGDSEARDYTSHQAKESCDGERYLTARGLEQEARLLLDQAKTWHLETKSDWRPIIFVAYGLGGLVVKQAMVIANTESRYCDVALRTHQLVFVATPHNDADLATWEDILDEMIIAGDIKIKGRRSRILDELPSFQSSTSTGEDPSLSPGRPQMPQLLTTKKGPVTEPDLRGFLFPETLITDYMWNTEKLESSLFFADLLDFLQEFRSPPNHLIYRSTTLQVLDAQLDLDMSMRHVSKWQPSEQHSTQVVGPPGYGKATLVKLIAQKVMRYTHNAILLDGFLKPFQAVNLNVRTLLRAFIHQIVSQRPTLFPHIRPLYLKHRQSYGIKSPELLWTFLHILLRVSSEDWKIVIAVNDVHLWPKKVQLSLGALEEFLRSLNTNYLIISSSNSEIPDLFLASRQLIDLGLDDSHRNSFIKARAKAALFAQTDMPARTVPSGFREISLPDQLPVANVELYAKLLSRSVLISTSEAVDAALSDFPETEDVILSRCIETINPNLLSWCSSAISWVQKAARPLRMRELAVAVAIVHGPLELGNLISRIPTSIESDIARHMDVLLRVEMDVVHLYNASTRRFLAETRPEVQILQLSSHESLGCLCLQYIIEVVSKVPLDVCLAHLTWRGQAEGQNGRQADLEFLEYAVQNWPAHYHARIAKHSECDPQGPIKKSDELERSASEFLADDVVRKKWYRLFCSMSLPNDQVSDETGALEVATRLGLYSIVENLLMAQVGAPAETAGSAATSTSELGKLLRIAVRYGHSDLVNLLLRKGAETRDAVLEAAGLGQVDYLEKLLPEEASQDSHGGRLESALYEAAQAGSLSAVSFLARDSLEWTWKNSQRSTLLHAAATGGKVEILKRMMMGRALDLNATDDDGRSPLMIATQLNCVLVVEMLCERGANTTLADKDGRTALHYAIIKGADIVTTLLQYNVSPISPDRRGQTPLHLACQLGYLDIVFLMIKALKDGQSVDVRNENGETPLHVAAICGNSNIVSFLLERGADPLVKDSSNRKPIDLAAAGGHLDVFEALYPSLDIDPLTSETLIMQSAAKGQLLIVRFLLKTIDNIDFHVEGESPLSVAASKGFTEVVRLLLQKKADPNFADEDGRTPLYRAVSRRHQDVAVVLLNAEADPNSLDEERWTPLHQAASRGMTKMVEALLRHGATKNARTVLKDTPLHLSLQYPETVEKLLEFEPELNSLNYAGLTPLHVAVASDYVQVVKILSGKERTLIHTPDEKGYTPLHRSIDSKNDGTGIFEVLWAEGGLDLQSPSYRDHPPILYALVAANLNVVRFLLARHPEMAATRDSEGYSSIHVAASYGHAEILEDLVKDPGNVGVDTSSSSGKTPLHLAATLEGKETVQKLLDLGAKVNAVDRAGSTALYFAAYHVRKETIICLLDAGADPNIHGADLWSPLHAAADSSEILDVLLSNKAKIDFVAEPEGWTTLMRAAYWWNEEGMRTLLRHGADIEIVDREGRTALHIAERESDPRLSTVLLEASAKVTVADASRRTPLHYAVASFNNDSSDDVDSFNNDNGSAVKVRELLDKGAVVNCKDDKGDTPLHCAAASRQCSRLLMETLIHSYREKDLAIDEKNHDQQTPLHQALILGTFDVAEMLLRQGASIDERDGEGRSCLAMAAAGPDVVQKVEFLLKAGSDRETPPALWTLDDKIAAFMNALATDRGVAKVLAKDESELFQHQAETFTFTVLGICLDAGEHDEAVEFLRLGASPFLHKAGQLSALQHPSLVLDPDSPFIKACLEMLDTDLRSPDEQFQALRLSIEHGWTEMYVKTSRWQPLLAVTDKDGWTIHHFLFQNDGRGSIGRIPSAPGSTTELRTPTKLMIPEFWANTHMENIVVFSSNSEEVQYLGPTDTSQNVSVRADHSFPPRGVSGALYYFEIDISSDNDEDAAAENAAIIGIGVCGEYVNMRNGYPGWSTHAPSMGYHSDDGRVYNNTKAEEVGKETGRTFTQGDTVGCGIDWDNGSIYFTLNGEWIGDCETSIIYRKIFPLITMGRKACKLRVNFGSTMYGEGQTFKFSSPL